MTSSRKYTQSKHNSSIKSTISKKKISKLLLNNKSLFNSQKKSNLFQLKKHHSLSLVIDTKKNLIIEWKEGEREIYIEGTIGKVNNQYLVKSNEKKCNYFKLYLNLSNSVHRLKFKSNGKIRIYSFYIRGKNNVNDKKIFSFEETNNQDESRSTRDSSLISDLKGKNKINDVMNYAFSKKNYCNYFPTKEEMKKKPKNRPSHFPIECFHGINQKHNDIGNKEFLKLKDINFFNSNNDSYKSIDRKDHLIINHLCQKNVGKKLVNTFIVRYRHKNATFVYYN